MKVRLLPRAAEHRSDEVTGPYALVTLHRPSNVDDLPWLTSFLAALTELSRDLTILFPVHPRTRQRIATLGLQTPAASRVQLLDPKSYLEFLALQRHATVVITDSGGMQEETSFLGVPCLTLRENTERPITVSAGTNLLLGRDIARMETEVHRILAGEKKKASPIPLWDGHSAERIADVVMRRS